MNLKCEYAKWCVKLPFVVWTNKFDGRRRFYCAEHSGMMRRKLEPIFLSSWEMSFIS